MPRESNSGKRKNKNLRDRGVDPTLEVKNSMTITMDAGLANAFHQSWLAYEMNSPLGVSGIFRNGRGSHAASLFRIALSSDPAVARIHEIRRKEVKRIESMIIGGLLSVFAEFYEELERLKQHIRVDADGFVVEDASEGTNGNQEG